MKGDPDGGHRRCSEASFRSRRDLFAALEPDLDFLIQPGDNDWNECKYFSASVDDDVVKSLWRTYFALPSSPFNSFDRDPATLPFGLTANPTVVRDPIKPELLHFNAKGTAFFGINDPQASDRAPVNADLADANAAFLTTHLQASPCANSIVIFSHYDGISDEVAGALSDYYATECGPVPTLYVGGNSHWRKYRLEFVSKSTFSHENVLLLTTEAFEAGPLLVSIVEGDNGMHYFHIEDTDGADYDEDTNRVCPSRRR